MSSGYVHDTAIAMLCSTTMEPDASNNDKLPSRSGPTRKRNRIPKPEQWTKNQKKKLREEGKEYDGVHINEEGKAVYVKRPARELLERCKHTSPTECDANADAKKFECYKITDTERELIKQKFYQLSWNERRVFIACNVVTVKAGTRSKCVYYLSCQKERREVCVTFFCNTLSMQMRTINNWVRNSSFGMPDNKVERRPKSSPKLDTVLPFIKTLRLQESHKPVNKKKIYVHESYKTVTAIFKEYREKCLSMGVAPASIFTFSQCFTKNNYSLFIPPKDAINATKVPSTPPPKIEMKEETIDQ